MRRPHVELHGRVHHSLEVVGEDRRLQTVARMIGKLHGFLDAFETQHRKHRAKDLLLEGSTVQAHAG